MSRKIQLLAIDPQNDFCDLPPSYCPADLLSGRPVAPALPLQGAHAASFIQRGQDLITDIAVTLDSHHRLDIAHLAFWRCADLYFAKLSDSPGKTMCDDQPFLACLRQVFQVRPHGESAC
jgi:hypothetical protein